MVPYAVPFLELLRALPVFLSPAGEYGNMAWQDWTGWLAHIVHIFTALAGPLLLSAVALSAIHYRVRSGITRWLYRGAWILFALWLFACMCLWLLGYWQIAVPVGVVAGIVLIILWIAS